jgi:hypothetical protein
MMFSEDGNDEHRADRLDIFNGPVGWLTMPGDQGRDRRDSSGPGNRQMPREVE